MRAGLIGLVLVFAASLTAGSSIAFAGTLTPGQTVYLLFSLDTRTPQAATVDIDLNVGGPGGLTARLLDLDGYADNAWPFEAISLFFGQDRRQFGLSLPERDGKHEMMLILRAQDTVDSLYYADVVASHGRLLALDRRELPSEGFGLRCLFNRMVELDIAYDPDRVGQDIKFYIGHYWETPRYTVRVVTENVREFVMVGETGRKKSVEEFRVSPGMPTGEVTLSRLLSTTEWYGPMYLSAPGDEPGARYRGEIVFGDVRWVSETPAKYWVHMVGCSDGSTMSAMFGNLPRLLPLIALAGVVAAMAWRLRRRAFPGTALLPA